MLTHVTEVMRHFSADRPSISIAAPEDICIELKTALDDSKIAVYRLTGAASPVMMVQYVPRLAQIIDEQQPDLCHAHGLSMGIAAAFASRLSRESPPIVVTMHNMLQPSLPQRTAAAYLRREPNIRICAVSRAVAQSWEINAGTDAVEVIPNGWPTPRVNKSIDVNISSDVTFLYVGRLSREKGVDILLDAAVILSQISPASINWRLDIVGDGPKKASLKKRLIQEEAAEHIQFHGWQDDVAPYYRRSRVLILPSRCEGAGLVVSEAAAHGLPVIASRTGGLTELVGDRETGWLIPPDNPQALAQTMLFALLNPQIRLKMAANALSRAQQKPSWDEVAQKWEEFYSDIMAQFQEEQ